MLLRLMALIGYLSVIWEANGKSLVTPGATDGIGGEMGAMQGLAVTGRQKTGREWPVRRK
jgi:hypothetical protein